MANKKDRQESLPNVDGATFKVGDGAHVSFNGDAYPYTVIAVSDSGRRVYVSRDSVKVTDGLGGYVEGPRECEFTTHPVTLDECSVYVLYKSGHFHLRENDHRHRAWSLQPGRIYAQNPSF